MSPRSSEPDGARPASTLTAEAADGGTEGNPFPGPRPFSESENGLFFGRERELTDLVALLFAQRAVLVHGPSGGGKSSLVSAGLIPRARARGFEFLPVARVRDAAGQPHEEVTGNRYVHNVIENWRDAGVDVAPDCATLADALAGLPAVDEPGRVVIFDQFEELFVFHPECWKDRADLLAQVQGALDRDPLLHVLFVVRDDYLARLEPLTPLLRDRLSTRYHLRGLSSAQALVAVVKPFAATGRTFAPGVAEQLVKALREQPAEVAGAHSYEGEDVEPVQLQIVCRALFERLPRDVVEIRAEHVQRHADVQRALVGFYEQAVAAAIKGHPGVHERGVRLWFERQLITPARTRGIVFRGERTTAGLPNEIVDELERRRVVRSEPRGPATWYELSHDRLVDAVLGSNRIWYAARSRTVTRRSALVAGIGVLAAVVSFLVFARGGGGNGSARAPAPQRARISVPGQTVDFPVSGRAGQLLTAIMTPDEKFVGQLRLFDARGAAIAEPSAPDSSRPVLTAALPADGDYRVEALGQGSSTGSFAMSLSVQDVDARTELLPLRPAPGAVTKATEVDVYTFAGRAGTATQITMTGGASLHERLVLLAPGGRAFVNTEDQYSSLGMLLVVLPEDGTYELRASSARGVTGSYRIDLRFPDAVATSGTTTGTVDPRDHVDVRTVRSGVGGAVDVSAAFPSSGFVSLLADDGRELAYADVQKTGERGFTSVVAPGTPYLLVMTPYSSDPAPFSLTLSIADAVPLAGGRADGEVARPGQLATFLLGGRQGDVATVLVSPVGDFDPGVRVVEPGGKVLTDQDGGGAGQDELFTVQLRKTGPHLLVVGSATTSKTGRFRVAVSQGKPTTPPS